LSDIISVEHLAYTYPGVEGAPGIPVFEDLNLTVQEGSFVAILGTNGCGKSTLAKHFNAILLPTGGKVYVCGIDTSDENRILSVRRNVGMVFQNPDNQIVANVVEEDVAFGPENLGIASPEIRRRVDSRWTCTSTGSTPPIFCPAGRSSASPSRALLPWSLSVSFWTSPPPCWIPEAAGRS